MKPEVANDNNSQSTPIILSIKGDSSEFMPNEDVPLTLIQDGRVLQSSGSSEQDGNISWQHLHLIRKDFAASLTKLKLQSGMNHFSRV